MRPPSEIRLYRIEQKCRKSPEAKPPHGRRARADPRRNDGGRRVSWPDDSRLRGAGSMSQQVSSAVAGPLQRSKFIETAFSPGRSPAIVSCAFAPNRLRRRRDWSQPARIQAAWARFAFECLARGKLGPCSILYRPLLAISTSLQRYEPLSQGDRNTFELLLFSRSVKGAPFEFAPSRSAGRGVPCLRSNRPARLPRK
jgi:hypothetical protein